MSNQELRRSSRRRRHPQRDDNIPTLRASNFVDDSDDEEDDGNEDEDDDDDDKQSIHFDPDQMDTDSEENDDDHSMHALPEINPGRDNMESLVQKLGRDFINNMIQKVDVDMVQPWADRFIGANSNSNSNTKTITYIALYALHLLELNLEEGNEDNNSNNNNNNNDNNNNNNNNNDDNDDDEVDEIRFRMIDFVPPQQIISDGGPECGMCENPACTKWQSNESSPNKYFFCLDCSGTRDDDDDTPYTPWPYANDMPTYISESDYNLAFQAAIQKHCTSNEDWKAGTTEIPRPEFSLWSNDNISTTLPPNLIFRSLSKNNNSVNSVGGTCTDSQVAKNGRTNGLAEILSVAGPYTHLKLGWVRAVQVNGREYKRLIPMGNGKLRSVHCIVMNIFQPNANEEQIKRDQDFLTIPYNLPVWNQEEHRLEISSTERKVSKVSRVIFLNHWWQEVESYCLQHDTMDGCPPFSAFQIDHGCHNQYCVCWNHLRFTYNKEANESRHACVGPPHCQHGLDGVKCMIPGHRRTGINRSDIKNFYLFKKKIRTLPPFRSKSMGYPLPNSYKLLNINFRLECAIPLRPLLGTDGREIKVKLSCYVCCQLSFQAVPDLSEVERKKIKKGEPGYVNEYCRQCVTCGIFVCMDHGGDDHGDHPLLTHHDSVYHENEQTEYEERIDGFYKNTNRFVSEIE